MTEDLTTKGTQSPTAEPQQANVPSVESDDAPEVVVSAFQEETTKQLLHRLKKGDRRVLEAMRRTRKKYDDELKSIRDMKAEIDQVVGGLDTLRNTANEILADIQSTDTTAKDATNATISAQEQAQQVAKLAAELRPKLEHLAEEAGQIDDRAKQAAERSRHIYDGFKYVQEARPQVEEAANKVLEAAGEAEGLLEKANQRDGRSEQLESSLKELVTSSKVAAAKVEDFVEELSNAESQVHGYKADLEEQAQSAEELATRVESLLPGATSAGLASAFMDRAKTFWLPAIIWNAGSAAAILGLIGFGMWLLRSESPPADVPELLWTVATRGPLIGGLVWLAIYAGRRGAAANKVGEDYAYKGALAQSFEGYKTQLSDIQGDGVRPLIQHCENVLANLSLQPGRLYDTRYEQATPVEVASESVGGFLRRKKAKVQAPGINVEVEDSPVAEESVEQKSDET